MTYVELSLSVPCSWISLHLKNLDENELRLMDYFVMIGPRNGCTAATILKVGARSDNEDGNDDKNKNENKVNSMRLYVLVLGITKIVFHLF